MDVELVKYMSATRDLIYATLALNGILTVIVAIHLGFLLKRVFGAAHNGEEPYDLVTNKKLKDFNKTADQRAEAAISNITHSFDARFLALGEEFKYQRKKMNLLLIIQRRIHDFTVLHRQPAGDLPEIEEDGG